MKSLVIGFICLEWYLSCTFMFGRVQRIFPETRSLVRSEIGRISLNDTERNDLPTRLAETEPQLHPLIFFRLLFNNLKDGQENQFYFEQSNTFVVLDRMELMGYEPVVTRAIAIEEFRSASHSTAFLRFPKGRSLADLDTRFWEVDKRATVWAPYEHAMLDSMFASQAIPRNRSAKANVLSIGLGGSSFNNYMESELPNFNITVVELDPIMLKISKDWYDLQLSDRHDVIIEDGVVFLDYAVNKSLQYDAILLDATHSVDFHFTVSPVAVFYEDKQLENMAKLLGENGVLIINVMFGRQYNVAIASDIFSDIHLKYFKYVEIRKVSSEARNLFLVARQKPFRFSPKPRIVRSNLV